MSERPAATAAAVASHAWSLRRVAGDDIDPLHALCGEPEVYHYLFDGAPPAHPAVAAEVEASLGDRARCGAGMLVLQGPDRRIVGAARLKPDAAARSAELTYLLDPALWGRGLATRMAWTAIRLAFLETGIESVIAGADRANTRSFALMRRLGMRFRADVAYPLGPGAEYVRLRGDPDPVPTPELLPVVG